MQKSNLPIKKTKIVATIGPATESLDVLEELICNGMNIARINFSHGSFEKHAQVIETIRTAAEKVGQRVAIMGDLPGPKMRIGVIEREPIQLVKGQPFVLQTQEMVGNEQRVSMSFAHLSEVVQPGDKIFINDGYIQLEVEEVLPGEVRTIVLVGGELRSRKGVNFPGIDLGIAAFTERDRECLQFAYQYQLDAVSQSFVQDAADIEAVRQAARSMHYEPFIIAKIERARALNNLDNIIRTADGIMVARGDLGVEVPFEQVAIIQKEIIHKANLAGKPVITATHMLESMITNRRPTRAEVTDVSNAILDGTDCVMLSGETSVGQYPAESVAAMSSIACFTEMHQTEGFVPEKLRAMEANGKLSRKDRISLSVYLTVDSLEPGLVFTMTTSGNSARKLARFRHRPWVIAISQVQKICQELSFSYGVFPVFEPEKSQHWNCYAANWVKEMNLDSRLVIFTGSTETLRKRDTTSIEVIDLS